jgi:hypothetical protein
MRLGNHKSSATRVCSKTRLGARIQPGQKQPERDSLRGFRFQPDPLVVRLVYPELPAYLQQRLGIPVRA